MIRHFLFAGVALGAYSAFAQNNTVAWGDNRFNQTNVPSTVTNVVNLGAGRNHTFALLADTTVAVWGTNDWGQLNVPAGLTNVTAIAAGGYHNLALCSDGSIVAWGRNTYGQTNIHPAATNVVAVAAGDFHNVVLRADGSVFAWGYNLSGQTNLSGVGTNKVVAVGAGGNQTIALYENGMCKGWGSNGYGTPIPPNSLNNVVAIAVGASQCVSLRSDGTVVVWGNPYNAAYNIPAAATNGVLRIAIGATNGLVLRTNGVLTAWGNNTYSQTNVPPSATNAVLFAVGGTHCVAALATGAPQFITQPKSASAYVGSSITFAAAVIGPGPITYQWRRANATQDAQAIWRATNNVLTLLNLQTNAAGTYDLVVSNSAGTNISTPAVLTVVDSAPTISQPPSSIAISRDFSVTLNVAAEGSLPLSYQWQRNGVSLSGANGSALVYPKAQLTNNGTYQVIISNNRGSVTSAPVALEVVSIITWSGSYGSLPLGLTNAVGIDAGRAHYVARTADGRAISWGSYIMGSSAVPDGLTNIVAVCAGYDHNLAIRDDSTVTGWGSDYDYNSIRVGQATPPAGLSNVVALGAGAWHSLAVKSDGSVVGWGSGGGFVPAGLSNIVAASGGQFHSIFLTSTGTVIAAGNNNYGQCSVPSGLSNVIAIKADYVHSMALLANGDVKVWGGQSSAVGLNAIAIGGAPCALRSNGTVVAWGSGSVPNPAPTGVVAVAATVYQSCFLLNDGQNVTSFALNSPQVTNGVFTVGVPTTVGRPYFLQFSDSPQGPWNVATGVAGNGTTHLLSDPAATFSQRFYRVFR